MLQVLLAAHLSLIEVQLLEAMSMCVRLALTMSLGITLPVRRITMSMAKNRGKQKPRSRHSTYKAVDDYRIMLEEKAKNCVKKSVGGRQ